MMIWGFTVACFMMLILVLIFFCDVICIIEFLWEEFVWTHKNVELWTWMILVLEYDIRANLRDLGFWRLINFVSTWMWVDELTLISEALIEIVPNSTSDNDCRYNWHNDSNGNCAALCRHLLLLSLNVDANNSVILLHWYVDNFGLSWSGWASLNLGLSGCWWRSSRCCLSCSCPCWCTSLGWRSHAGISCSNWNT